MSYSKFLHCLLLLLLLSKMDTKQDTVSPMSTLDLSPPETLMEITSTETLMEMTSTETPDKMIELGTVLNMKCDKGLCTMSKNSSLYDKWQAMKSMSGMHNTMHKLIKMKFPENLKGDEYILNEILGMAMNKFMPKEDLKKEYESIVEGKVNLLKREGRYYKSPKMFQCENSDYPEEVQDCTNAINEAYAICFDQYKIQQDSRKEFCDIAKTLNKCQDIFKQKIQPRCSSDPMPLLETLLEGLCAGNENEKCSPGLNLLHKDFQCIPEGMKQDFKNLGQLLPEERRFQPQELTLCEMVSDYVNNTVQANTCPFLNEMGDCIHFYRQTHAECHYDTGKIKRLYFKTCVEPQMRMEEPPESAAGTCQLSIMLGLVVAYVFFEISVNV